MFMLTCLCHLAFSLYSAGRSSDWHCPLHLASCRLQVPVKQEPGRWPDPYCDGYYLLSLATEGTWIEPDIASGWPVANIYKTARWRTACRFRLTLARTGVLGMESGPLAPDIFLPPNVPTNLFRS